MKKKHKISNYPQVLIHVNKELYILIHKFPHSLINMWIVENISTKWNSVEKYSINIYIKSLKKEKTVEN